VSAPPPLPSFPKGKENYTLTSPLSRWERVRVRGNIRLIRSIVIYTILALLLWWALRTVPFIDIWNAFRQLRLWQLGTLFGLNILVLGAMTARWWAILHTENPGIPFLQLVRYRLAVFGLSYFTPGPQVGGEPLQVFYLQRDHGVTFARATAAVIMDKLLEFLANFILLAVGLTAAVRVGLITRNSTQALGSLIPLAALVAAHPPGAALSGQVSSFSRRARCLFFCKKTKMDAARGRLGTHGWRLHPSSSQGVADRAGVFPASLGRNGRRVFHDGRISPGPTDGGTNSGRIDRRPIRLLDAFARWFRCAGSQPGLCDDVLRAPGSHWHRHQPAHARA
jgi:hypothetical protein